MRMLLAGLAVFSSVVTATAAETYSDYRDYFDSEPAVSPSAGRKSLRKTGRPADAIDTRRYDEGPVAKNPGNLRPGYRGASGTYVPPDYSTHPHGSASETYGSFSAPNPFSGSLGTRR